MAKPLDELDIIARGIVGSAEDGLSNNIPVIKDLCRRAYDNHTISSLVNIFILKNPKKLSIHQDNQHICQENTFISFIYCIYLHYKRAGEIQATTTETDAKCQRCPMRQRQTGTIYLLQILQ